jgi:hypothetical protein
MPDLDDEAITVTLPVEEGEAVITKVEGQQKAATEDPIQDLKGQFETLKGTLNQTTQRLAGAERELQTRDQQLAEVRKEVTSSQLDTVTTGIQAAEAEADAAERAYISAYEAGDGQAMAKAQRRIAGAEAKVQRLKEAEGDLKEQATAKPAPRPEVRRQVDDPVEALASTLAPRAAAWIRAHPECVTDEKLNARMMAGHNLAKADGYAEGSDDYFRVIDEMVSSKQADGKQVKIRPSAPVAPTGGSGGMGGGGTTVTLSAREAQAATDGTHVWNYGPKKGEPIGTVEFARRKMAMTKEGHYDRSRDLQ